MSTRNFSEANWAAGRPYLSIGSWQGDDRSYRENTYRHPAGLVEVYEQTGKWPMTSLRFRFKGRDYTRRWDAVWGDKTLARLSRELIESVVKEWADGHRGSF